MSLAEERAQLEKVSDPTTQQALWTAIKKEYGSRRAEFRAQTLPGGPMGTLSPVVFDSESPFNYARLFGQGLNGWVRSEFWRDRNGTVINRRVIRSLEEDILQHGRVKKEDQPYPFIFEMGYPTSGRNRRSYRGVKAWKDFGTQFTAVEYVGKDLNDLGSDSFATIVDINSNLQDFIFRFGITAGFNLARVYFLSRVGMKYLGAVTNDESLSVLDNQFNLKFAHLGQLLALGWSNNDQESITIGAPPYLSERAMRDVMELEDHGMLLKWLRRYSVFAECRIADVNKTKH